MTVNGKPTRALLVKTDGTVTEISFTPVNEYDTLKDALDDGFLGAVYSRSGDTTFWVDDEGKLKNLPRNLVATALLYKLNPAFVGMDVLCGPVVITGGANDDGYCLSVPAEVGKVMNELGVKYG